MEQDEYIIRERNAASAGKLEIGLNNDTSAPLSLLPSQLAVVRLESVANSLFAASK